MSRRQVALATICSYAYAVKACILGTTISQFQYEGNTQPTTAIMFLSTPHYGSDLASLLQHILGLSFFGDFSKPYVSELTQNSRTLLQINSQFLTMVPLPTVASFYETMRTSVGPVKKVGNPYSVYSSKLILSR